MPTRVNRATDAPAADPPREAPRPRLSAGITKALDALAEAAPDAVGARIKLTEALTTAVTREAEEKRRADRGGLVNVSFDLEPEDAREVVRFVARLKQGKREKRGR